MLLYIVYSGTLAQEISFSVHIRVCLNEMDRKGFLKMETQQRCRLRYEAGTTLCPIVFQLLCFHFCCNAF